MELKTGRKENLNKRGTNSAHGPKQEVTVADNNISSPRRNGGEKEHS